MYSPQRKPTVFASPAPPKPHDWLAIGYGKPGRSGTLSPGLRPFFKSITSFETRCSWNVSTTWT